jgi:allophanate hydrolase
VIGDQGKMGRLLVRGEYGHDIVDELKPLPGEVVIDKPGKGSFWNTTILHKLKARAITHLIVSGVTTECCFATSIREGNDRGFECCKCLLQTSHCCQELPIFSIIFHRYFASILLQKSLTNFCYIIIANPSIGGIEEATAGYNASFKCSSLDMIHWSQGLFGFVASLDSFEKALKPYVASPESISLTTPPQTPPTWNGDLRIPSLQAAYHSGLSPMMVVESLYKTIEAYSREDEGVWIHLEKKDAALAAAKALITKYPDKSARPPLFGIPFSIKDSLDITGLPTTTACPPLTHMATTSSPVYEKIIEEGALFIGKVNLDQLATGLTGCRSPYGLPHSVFHKDYISGGSSSGSCVSVGANLVSFSIATDTAGSGRVPSGFNGVVGYKPTRGLLSTFGLVPACLSLDCIAIIAKTVSDARLIWQLCEDYDERDRYAKRPICFERHVNSIGPESKSFKFGIPTPEALSACSPIFKKMYHEAVKQLQSIGGVLTPIDWSPFDKSGRLLYDGTFVSERLASLPDDWLDKNREHLHPVIAELFDQVVARQSTAVQAFRDLQAKALFIRQAEKVFEYSAKGVDVVVVPTAPTHWKIEQVLADPIKKNSALGEFTHFGNVLDLCAVAVPAGEYKVSELSGKEQDSGVLPFSITFLGGSRLDAEVLEIARRFEESMAKG